MVTEIRRLVARHLCARRAKRRPPPGATGKCRAYDRDLYAARHPIEHCCCKLKQCRAIATRYDKTRRNFLAGVHLAATVILLN